MRHARLPLVLAATLALGACTSYRSTKLPSVPGETSGFHAVEGLASWYGPGFHGRLTASGEVYDQTDLTCAHRTLPFGTKLLVRNLQNGRTLWVRVNDRGPYIAGRIVDLSYTAAEALGVVGPGTAPVRLEMADAGTDTSPAVNPGARPGPAVVASMALPPLVTETGGEPRPQPVLLQDVPAPRTGWSVQLGAFALEENAARLAQDLARRGIDARVQTDDALARVRIEGLDGADAAERLAERLRRDGFEAIVVHEPSSLAQTREW